MPGSAAVTAALAPSMAPTRMPQSDGRCCTGFGEPTQDILMRSSHAPGLGHRPVSTSTSEGGRSQDRPLACGAVRPTAIVSTPELTTMCSRYSQHKAGRWRARILPRMPQDRTRRPCRCSAPATLLIPETTYPSCPPCASQRSLLIESRGMIACDKPAIDDDDLLATAFFYALPPLA